LHPQRAAICIAIVRQNARCGDVQDRVLVGREPRIVLGHRRDVGGREGLAVDDVALAGIAAVRIAFRRADDQVVVAVVVDVSRRADRRAGLVIGVDTFNDETADAQGNLGELNRLAVGLAEYDITLTGTTGTVGIGVRRADNQVGQAVAVDVARAADRKAGPVVAIDAVDGKAARAVRHVRQLDRRGSGLAEHDITLAGFSVAVGIGAVGADDYVEDTVAVDVARAADRFARAVVAIDAVDDKAARAVHDIRQLDRTAVRFAEHDVTLAGVVTVRVGVRRAHDKVVQAVAVHVADGADRSAGKVRAIDAVDGKAARAVRHVRQLDRTAVRLAEHDIALAGLAAVRIGPERADDHIRQAVTVHVARAADRVAGLIVAVDTLDHEAAAPRRDGGQFDRIGIARLAEHDITLAGLSAVRIAARRADNNVIDAVAVDVARAAH